VKSKAGRNNFTLILEITFAVPLLSKPKRDEIPPYAMTRRTDKLAWMAARKESTSPLVGAMMEWFQGSWQMGMDMGWVRMLPLEAMGLGGELGRRLEL
jgi:hypothetical protein